MWDICFFIGSLLPALLLGVAVGNIYAGIPMDAAGNYNGVPLLGLVTPFTLLCGLLGLAMFCCAGAAWIALKAPETSRLRDRATKTRAVMQFVALLLFVFISLYGHFIIRPEMTPALGVARWACVIVFVLGMVLALHWGRDEHRDLHVFVAQSAAALGLTFLAATSMFPNRVVASADRSGPAITVATAASSDLALTWMTGIACIGVPLVLVYHVFVYRTFRGRLTEDDLNH